MSRRLLTVVSSLSLFTLAITGCQNANDTENSSEDQTMEAPTETTQQPAETDSASPVEDEDTAALDTCSSAQYVGTIVPNWDMVVASKDASDHKERIESLQDDLDDHIQSDSSEAPCTGAVELAEFNYELASLNMALVTGVSEEDYGDAAEAGNEWLEAIEPDRDYSFEAEYSN